MMMGSSIFRSSLLEPARTPAPPTHSAPNPAGPRGRFAQVVENGSEIFLEFSSPTGYPQHGRKDVYALIGRLSPDQGEAVRSLLAALVLDRE